MKVSVYLKKSSSSTSNICFRVREKNVDIKVVSPLVVHDKYWDSDTLSYKRTTAVPAVEQKLLPEQIASIIEKVEKTFSDKANSAWLKQTIEDVLYPARAFERNHPNLICRPVRIQQIPHLIDADIAFIILAIAVAAKSAVLRLPNLQIKQILPDWRCKRQRPAA